MMKSLSLRSQITTLLGSQEEFSKGSSDGDDDQGDINTCLVFCVPAAPPLLTRRPTGRGDTWREHWDEEQNSGGLAFSWETAMAGG